MLEGFKTVGHNLRKSILTRLYKTPSDIGRLQSDLDLTVSFSQRGEDLVAVDWLHRMKGVPFHQARYLDIGANHPRRLSNTYLLWAMGVRGVLIEPNPAMADLLRSERPGDVVIEAGIAFDERRSATLFCSTDPALSGYISSNDAVGEVETSLIPINDVLAQHFPDRAPDFLSIDAEECDYPILLTLDFNRWRPYLICVETGDGATGLPGFLLDKQYEIVLHSGSNTMLIDRA